MSRRAENYDAIFEALLYAMQGRAHSVDVRTALVILVV